MSHAVILVLVVALWTIGFTRGESAVFIPPMELRMVPIERSPFSFAPSFDTKNPPTALHSQHGAAPTPTLSAHVKRCDPIMSPSEPVAAAIEPAPAESVQQHRNETSAGMMHDLLDSLGLEDDRSEEQEPRAAEEARKYGKYDPYAYSHYPDYGYSGKPHGYWQPYPDHSYDYSPPPPPPTYHAYPPYHPYSPPPSPPKPAKPTKPVLPSLPKPTAVKPALPTLLKPDLTSKLPALVNLVQGLFTSPSTGTGLASVGGTLTAVLRPLLAAKSNLKSLIGKLLVPLIVLVLVNLEVLALTWWLWEDCTQEVAKPAADTKPAPAPAAHSPYYYRAAPPQPESAPKMFFYR